MNYINQRYVRYIPKKMREYLVWLDRIDNECDGSHVYFITFEKDGVEYHTEPCDTVSEITWNSRETGIEMGILQRRKERK